MLFIADRQAGMVAEHFVLCTDAHGQVERYGLFELQWVGEEETP